MIIRQNNTGTNHIRGKIGKCNLKYDKKNGKVKHHPTSIRLLLMCGAQQILSHCLFLSENPSFSSHLNGFPVFAPLGRVGIPSVLPSRRPFRSIHPFLAIPLRGREWRFFAVCFLLIESDIFPETGERIERFASEWPFFFCLSSSFFVLLASRPIVKYTTIYQLKYILVTGKRIQKIK